MSTPSVHQQRSANLASWLAIIVLLGHSLASANTIITNDDVVVLMSAVESGGNIALSFDGTVLLKQSLTISKDTTLDGSGHIVKLDGGGLVRHFVVTNGATLQLVNLTLMNGQSRGIDGQPNEVGGNAQGGSIIVHGSTLELTSCRLLNNAAHAGEAGSNATTNFTPSGGVAFGGALYSADGAIFATNCVFAGNRCQGGHGAPGPSQVSGAGGDAFGGALYVTNSQVNLDGVILSNNIVLGGEPGLGRVGWGGGSAIGGAAAIELRPISRTNSIVRCEFNENQAISGTKFAQDQERTFADGGALFVGSGSLWLQQTSFRRNLTLGSQGWDPFGHTVFGDARGGAIFNRDAEIRLLDSSVIANQAQGGSVPEQWSGFDVAFAGNASGGAIYNSGSLFAANSTVAENSADGGTAHGFSGNAGSSYGGAIFSQAKLYLLNVTLARNSANPGRADTDLHPPEDLGDTLHIAAGTAALTNSILSSLPGRTNVWGALLDGGHNLSSDDSAKFTSASSRNSVDPLLGPPGNYGGPTPTVPLLFGSPAINTADLSSCPPTDQRGVARPIGGGCDIGAFEFAPRLSLTVVAGRPVTVRYEFEAGLTNGISASTNLVDWEFLGERTTDTNGVFEIEDPGSMANPLRFYRLDAPRD